MSRKSDSDADSLDLLLDTICNTFGGVLFISILVVVLISVTSSQRTIESADASEQYAAAQRKLAQSQLELKEIKERLRQQKLVENAIYDPAIAQDLESLRDTQIAMADLLIGKGNMQGTILSTARQIGTIEAEMQEAQQALQVSQQQLQSIEIELQTEIENRSQSAELPRATTVSKIEQVLFLKEDKLCAYSSAHPNEYALSNQAVEPRPAAGLAVTQANASALNTRLRNEYSPAKDALTVFVWPDSFDAFAVLKDRLVSLGFDYSVQPIPEDERIKVGTTSEQRDFMGR